MQLDDWMKANKVRATDLAAEWKVDPALISRLKSGKSRPTFDNLVRVFVTTGGLVGPEDWIALHKATLVAESLIPEDWKPDERSREVAKL